MRPIKTQFFVSFAVIGSVMPLLPVILQKGKGLSLAQVGTALALMSVSSLFSPVIATLLADLRMDSRKVLSASLLTGALALSGIALATTPSALMAMAILFGLALAAAFPLQDAFYFASARSEEAKTSDATAIPPYSRIRVWGTIGFIVPCFALFALMRSGFSSTVALGCGAVACAIAAVTAIRLRPIAIEKSSPIQTGRNLPSFTAARTLFGKKGIAFSIALALGHFAAPVYNGYFPIYLTEISGIADAWVAPTMNYGILLEVFFTLAIPWLLKHLGVRKLFMLGFAVMAARLWVLSLTPPFYVVFLAQSLHGLEIISLYILPVVYIDRLAGDSFRNSVQGVYAMLVAGVSKVAGYQCAGQIADHGLPFLFLTGSIVATAAVIVIALFLPHSGHTVSRDAA